MQILPFAEKLYQQGGICWRPWADERLSGHRTQRSSFESRNAERARTSAARRCTEAIVRSEILTLGEKLRKQGVSSDVRAAIDD